MDKKFLLSVVPFLLLSHNANSASAAFDTCPYTAFLMQDSQTNIYGVNLLTGAFQTLQTDVGQTGNLNAAGYNETDNFIYAFNTTQKKVVQVGNDFKATTLPVTGLPDSPFYVGDVANNTYYLYRSGLYTIPLDENDPNYLKGRKIEGSDGSMKITDFAFHPDDGNIYAVDNKQGHFYRINPNDGSKTILGNAGVTGTFGAAYFEASGNFYFSRNQDGIIFTIDVSDPNNIDTTAVQFAAGPKSGLNDGVRCASAPVEIESIDLGDAPDSYQTSVDNNGARHDLSNNSLFLGGVAPDSESVVGTSDDATGVDDEDGVIITPLQNGEQAMITVTANQAGGFLNAWIDWNKDGDFSDNNEQISTGQALSAGMNSLVVNVPDFVTAGETWARFRLSSAENLPAFGGAPDGEVEDYQVTLENAQLNISRYGPFTAAFEDSWPREGDYDLNDVVMRYQIEIKTDQNDDARQIKISGTLQALGADYRNGFGIHLPRLSRSSVDEDNIIFTRNGRVVADSPLETGQGNAVIIISQDLSAHAQTSCRFHRTRENCQEIEKFNFSVTLPLIAGVKSWTLPAAPFDPFIFAVDGFNHGEGTSVGRGLEIHLDDYEPTDLGNASLELMGNYDDRSDNGIGSLYRTENGLPWGFIVTETWSHPLEQVDMLLAYPRFFDYATTGAHVDWFIKSKRVSQHLYGLE
ncbi:LruC domain-containing protein [Photobacterium sp. DNB23_23_1]|uniref:LruC domain-containing protein n=1 Tax=Photobacterium pectinilyticum TaxID=2906793 RepID=A0ABT1MY58_9GAMM|nr:LruC domain-containing protein [Photobacterium sp. ZSDE20]MCQ1057212.1 LruC domain-containing protein [Photobacterium sp. ZSDE20]MDD1821347.1 LruC domain-containing protein [Photobacterium sp. ZSDE20]